MAGVWDIFSGGRTPGGAESALPTRMRIQGNRDIGHVDRPNIEAAAREGYLDRIAGKGFSRHYDAATPPWQRNYEIGRLRATGMIRCGIEPPDWPISAVGAHQQPAAIDAARDRVNAQIGALRPETTGPMAPDPDLPTLHVPVRVPRRLRRVA